MTKEDHHDHAHHGDRKGKGDRLREDSSTESKGKRDRSHVRDRRHHKEDKGPRKRERERDQGLSIHSQDDSDDDSHNKRHRKHHRSIHKKRRRGDDHNHHDDHSSNSDAALSDERHRHKSSHRKRESDQRKRKDKKSHHSKSEKKEKKSKKTKKERHKSSRDADELNHGEQHRGKPTSTGRSQSTRHQHDKKALYSMGEPLGQPPLTLINPEMDYFTYHQEFWVYLFREEGVRFNDLNSEEAREAFQRFAAQYNDGKLEGPYYDNPPTFPAEVLDECKTTDHKWGFQTTEAERRGLEKLQEGVRRLTQYQDQKDEEAIGTKEGPSSAGVAASRAREGDDAAPSRPRQKTSEE